MATDFMDFQEHCRVATTVFVSILMLLFFLSWVKVKMKGKIIPDFLANHGSKKRLQKRNSQQKQSSHGLPLNIGDRAKEQVAELPTRITKDQICSNATGPVGRFKEGVGSDTVSRNEDSEDSGDTKNEINLLNMNFSEMNSFERNSSMKLLNNPSLTSAERQNLCLEIGIQQSS